MNKKIVASQLKHNSMYNEKAMHAFNFVNGHRNNLCFIEYVMKPMLI